MSKTIVKLFSAEWCQPCKALKPALQAQSKKLGYTLQIVDVDKESIWPYDIQGIPAVAIEKDGKLGIVLAGGSLVGRIAEKVK